MIEGKEIELQPVIPDVPIAIAGDRLRGGIKRRTLLVRVPVDKVKDSV
jgi:hypothetical protein